MRVRRARAQVVTDAEKRQNARTLAGQILRHTVGVTACV